MIEIEITKHAEDDAHTVYDFCTNTSSPGRLRLDRTTGQVIHLHLCGCAGDPEYHGRRAGRGRDRRGGGHDGPGGHGLERGAPAQRYRA